MKPNQTLKQDNLEVALFPMETLTITQGRYSNFSHKGYNATDLAGKDTGIDSMYAPFTLRVEWKDTSSATGVAVSNVNRVLMANGKIAEPRTLFIVLWHDNNITDLKVGQIIKQGVRFYDEGTTGFATGNHIHIELSNWRYDGTYPLYKLANGYWTSKGTEVNIEDLFYVNDTVIKQDGGYKFKTYIAPKPSLVSIPEVYAFKPNTIINVRDFPSEKKGKVVGSVNAGDTVNYFAKVEHEGYVWLVTSEKHYIACRTLIKGVRGEIWGTLVPQASVIKKGSRVKVKKGAKSYTGGNVASFVYGKVYTVDELKGDRAVLDTKGINSPFNTKDLELVS